MLATGSITGVYSDSDEDDARDEALFGQAMDSIDNLRAQSEELLSAKWKEPRNKHLLNKMLELEEPIITAKMVDFLLQDDVCDTLLSYVTQLSTGIPRPGPNDPKTDALKTAYKVVMLLSAEEPSEPLMAFLGKKAAVITRAIFDIFRDDSAGSFFHAYRVLECLLRFFPTDVFEGICAEGKAAERMSAMLRYVGYVPVGELFLTIVALTPVPRTSPQFTVCAKSRWAFFEQISQWNMLLRVVEAIARPQDVCYLSHSITEEQHAAAAVQLFQDLVEKLSLEDTGELLLQPIGYTTALLNHLLDVSLSATADEGLRRYCTKTICSLLRRAADPEIICIVTPAGGAPTPSSVTNRLYPLRERIIAHVGTRLGAVIEAISRYALPPAAGEGAGGSSIASISSIGSVTSIAGPVKYSGYEVRQPFSTLRSYLVELLVLMVESDESIASNISQELWKLLMEWTLTYAHNNIYHSMFYRLVFAVLRQNQEAAQRMLFMKAKLTNFLIDAFVPYPLQDADIPPKGAPERVVNMYVARGLVLNVANAVRLQASCQPPSAFIRQYLSSNQKWLDFQPRLATATDVQQRFGMGIKVTDNKPTHSYSSLIMLINEPKPDDDGGTEHGSRFARSLGFYDDQAWPAENAAEARKRRIKRNKKKKQQQRKSLGGKSAEQGASQGADAEEEEEEDDDEAETEEGARDGDDDDDDDDDFVDASGRDDDSNEPDSTATAER